MVFCAARFFKEAFFLPDINGFLYSLFRTSCPLWPKYVNCKMNVFSLRCWWAAQSSLEDLALCVVTRLCEVLFHPSVHCETTASCWFAQVFFCLLDKFLPFQLLGLNGTNAKGIYK